MDPNANILECNGSLDEKFDSLSEGSLQAIDDNHKFDFNGACRLVFNPQQLSI